jgi:hypothetical protein
MTVNDFVGVRFWLVYIHLCAVIMVTVIIIIIIIIFIIIFIFIID